MGKESGNQGQVTFILGSFSKTRSKEWADLFGKTAASTMVSLRKIKSNFLSI